MSKKWFVAIVAFSAQGTLPAEHHAAYGRSNAHAEGNLLFNQYILESPNTVRQLLRDGTHRADEKNAKGSTAMHFCALYNCSDTVHVLAERNTTLINVKNNEGNTPLHIAAGGRYH